MRDPLVSFDTPFQSGDGLCYPTYPKNYYNTQYTPMFGGKKIKKQKGGNKIGDYSQPSTINDYPPGDAYLVNQNERYALTGSGVRQPGNSLTENFLNTNMGITYDIQAGGKRKNKKGGGEVDGQIGQMSAPMGNLSGNLDRAKKGGGKKYKGGNQKNSGSEIPGSEYQEEEMYTSNSGIQAGMYPILSGGNQASQGMMQRPMHQQPMQQQPMQQQPMQQQPMQQQPMQQQPMQQQPMQQQPMQQQPMQQQPSMMQPSMMQPSMMKPSIMSGGKKYNKKGGNQQLGMTQPPGMIQQSRMMNPSGMQQPVVQQTAAQQPGMQTVMQLPIVQQPGMQAGMQQGMMKSSIMSGGKKYIKKGGNQHVYLQGPPQGMQRGQPPEMQTGMMQQSIMSGGKKYIKKGGNQSLHGIIQHGPPPGMQPSIMSGGKKYNKKGGNQSLHGIIQHGPPPGMQPSIMSGGNYFFTPGSNFSSQPAEIATQMNPLAQAQHTPRGGFAMKDMSGVDAQMAASSSMMGGYKRKSRKSKGGSSDFATTLSSRGPINYPDQPTADRFRYFNKTGTYIPNSQLQYAVAPISTGYSADQNSYPLAYNDYMGGAGAAKKKKKSTAAKKKKATTKTAKKKKSVTKPAKKKKTSSN